MAHMWHVRGERWESIPHRVLRDKRLTFRARGLLCYLLSLPDDWQTSVSRLRDLTSAKEPGRPYEGREALESAVHELEGCGYLYRWLRRNERGHVSGYVWAYSADVETAGDAGGGRAGGRAACGRFRLTRQRLTRQQCRTAETG